jgi:uncharacterized linocin/CFP29 family protein
MAETGYARAPWRDRVADGGARSELAPISVAAGSEIDAEATRMLKTMLAARKLVAIGYLEHDAASATLYLQESLTFRVLTPEAAAPLAYPAD